MVGRAGEGGSQRCLEKGHCKANSYCQHKENAQNRANLTPNQNCLFNAHFIAISCFFLFRVRGSLKVAKNEEILSLKPPKLIFMLK